MRAYVWHDSKEISHDFSSFLLFFFPSFTERERERGRETHLSIEPRRALAITRSAVRKRVASSFTAHRHSMALYFLSSDVSVSRTRLCRPPPPRPAAEYLTYCSRYIFRRAAALERYFTTRWWSWRGRASSMRQPRGVPRPLLPADGDRKSMEFFSLSGAIFAWKRRTDGRTDGWLFSIESERMVLSPINNEKRYYKRDVSRNLIYIYVYFYSTMYVFNYVNKFN